jgi:hypothetical protein
MEIIPILDGEEWWSTKVIDEADRLINQLIELVHTCLKREINFDQANELSEILSEHSSRNSIEINIDSWLTFCRNLSSTELSDDALIVERSIVSYGNKYLKRVM